MEDSNEQGRITIAPEVLTTICRLSTLTVGGVERMAGVPGGVNRLWKRTAASEGVQIVVDDQTVQVDLYVILKPDQSFRLVSEEIQANVTRDLEQMVGMTVQGVHVHIEDISYETSTPRA